ncbi:heavy metal sensor histidine kinase [Polaromonas sp.]|uniref:heavy metal sensor histidine kinase n=1 Tax=Polaromonas sp. TaxID=1869339 RepID=UPI001853BE2D|nr:heavy metal sensor histidine kinase [Polaromonas sp.]NMM06083.1 heavy metal sensor histidine kinase [Polaromonas sp.]
MNGRTSITRRLTLLFVFASSAVLLALGFVIASSVEKHFEQQDMEVLTGKMELAGYALEKLQSQNDLERMKQQLRNALVGHPGLDVSIFSPNQTVIFATPGASAPINLASVNARRNPHRPFTWTIGESSYRGIAAELSTGIKEQSRVFVAVSLDIAHHQAFLRSFLRTLWLFVAVAAALTGILGWAAARRGLAPLRAMREQAQVVTAQQLSHRLPLESTPVELAELAQSLNDMLARLEKAFHRLSDFSSDIAHELRTPVSNLMTETHVALSRQRSADDYRSILESNAEEFGRMARMISDMLLLAKAENGLGTQAREMVDLAAEVLVLFDYYDAVAEEKGLRLVLEGNGEVSADRLMLRRALGNLLSNGVRHSTANTTLNVAINTNKEMVSVCVKNIGDTIPQEYWKRVFDRFFRVDNSRQRSSEGTGLGLAIAKSIVGAHGGTITAESMIAVTTFTIRLPRGTDASLTPGSL